jgi:hypothetical protein
LSLAKHVAAPWLSTLMHVPQPTAQYDPHGQSPSCSHSRWQKPRVLQTAPSIAQSPWVSQRRGRSPMHAVTASQATSQNAL